MTDVTTYISQKMIGTTEKWISSNIISKWSRYRAEQFISSFLEEAKIELNNSTESNLLDIALRKVLKNEESEELLFESYRKVCLSASKDIGPKIIGLLTAKLIIEERVADDLEESILMLAEDMTDKDFIEFCIFYNEKLKGETEYLLGEEGRDSNSRHGKTSINAPSIVSELGIWAGKLERKGMLFLDTSVGEYDYDEDSERHVDEPGTVTTYTHTVIFEEGTSELYNFIRRAQGPETNTDLHDGLSDKLRR